MVDYLMPDNLAFLANAPTQAESLLNSLEQAAGGIGLHVNADKTEYMMVWFCLFLFYIYY